MTLKLDDSGCRICSISDDDANGMPRHLGAPGEAPPGGAGPHKEIVTNERYVVMPWKMVVRYGKNMTLKEAIDEIEKEGEERKLVSKLEAKHRDEIDKILGLRWSETKKLKILIPDNIFLLHLIIIKLFTLKQLENIHQKLKLIFS